MRKPFFYVCIVLSLTSCLAVGVPYTNDPYQLLRMGEELTDMQRGFPAGNALLRALEKFKESGNTQGIADTYFAIGRLEKAKDILLSSYPEGIKQIDAEFAFSEAERLYASLNANMDIAAAKFEHGNLYIKSDPDRGCTLYIESLEYYKIALNNGEKYGRLGMNPNFSTFDEMVKSSRDYFCK